MRRLSATAPRSLLCVLLVALPSATLAQDPEPADSSLFARLGLDRLGLVSLGFESGAAFPSQIESAPVVALVADYGEIASRWRVAIAASFWESNFRDDAVARLRDSLSTIVDDPGGNATVTLDRVRFTSLTIAIDLRRQLLSSRRFRPYVGTGLGAYATNLHADGLNGTLAENAFDTISAGVSALAGADLILLPNFAVTVHARYDLASTVRVGVLRAGGAYRFRGGSN